MSQSSAGPPTYKGIKQSFASAVFAPEEERLAGDRRNHRKLEGLGDKKRRLWTLAGQEALGVSNLNVRCP